MKKKTNGFFPINLSTKIKKKDAKFIIIANEIK